MNKRFLLLEKLEDVTQQLIRKIHTRVDSAIIYGITGSQYFVMKRIRECGKMTVSAVADYMGVSLSAVTTLVDRLYKAGLVSRTRDEDDRRLVWVEVTPKGKDVLKAYQAIRKQVIEKYLGQLSEEDLEQLLRIYEKLLAVISKNC